MNANPRSPAGPTILIVDDEPRVCHIFRKILGEDGYVVVTAANGREAVDVAIRERPRIVVLDLCMPEMDGIEALREMRKRGVDGAVIILTAQGTLETAREAMDLGAFDYITKPCNLNLFKEMLRDALVGAEAGAGA